MMANLVCLTKVAKTICYNVLKTNNVISRSFTGMSRQEGRKLSASTNSFLIKNKNHQIIPTNIILPQLQIVRSTSFYQKKSANELWKGVTSVSSAGNKRGRGSGSSKKMKKNLNKGQIFGLGKANIQWPGLTTPVLKGRELVRMQVLPEDKEREANMYKMRDTFGFYRPFRLDPLDRGWSGAKLGGRSLGVPASVDKEPYEGFEGRALEYKFVCHMSGMYGRMRRRSLFAVVGNKNGLVGFALVKSERKGLVEQCKQRASQKLMYIERYNDHTVLHDFFSQFCSTKLYVKKKPEGYGLRCHRVLRTICQVVGIKDIYVKAEGANSNVQNLAKAFFLGLLNQRSHQQLADEKQLHLVEFRKENFDFPKVVASPQSNQVRSLNEIPRDEELNFNQYVMDGKVWLEKKKYPPGYTKTYGYENYKKKYAKRRNQEMVKEDLRVQYGEVRSFYADKYPECRKGFKRVEEAVA